MSLKNDYILGKRVERSEEELAASRAEFDERAKKIDEARKRKEAEKNKKKNSK